MPLDERKTVELPIARQQVYHSGLKTQIGQFQHGSKWLGTLTSPILLILGPDVPPRELFKTPKNFRPRTPRHYQLLAPLGAMSMTALMMV